MPDTTGTLRHNLSLDKCGETLQNMVCRSQPNLLPTLAEFIFFINLLLGYMLLKLAVKEKSLAAISEHNMFLLGQKIK